MRVLCASDSFKETLSATEASNAMASGAVSAGAEADVCPIADGGEGSLDALVQAMDGAIHECIVTGPIGKPTHAKLGVSGDGAVGIVELAQAAGLAGIPVSQRDPTRTTTFGVGELISNAARRGCSSVILCIGGSGTCDGGAGIVQAIGARFIDERGRTINEPMTGGLLAGVTRIEPPTNRDLPAIRIACDVTNPLCGKHGSAAVYGPQKGATPRQVRELDANLLHLADLLGVDSETPGYGAAGGAAVCPVALCGAAMERGIELVLDAVNFRVRCQRANLVLTGEGRLDEQSLSGKATIGVARLARECGLDTIALVGSARAGATHCCDPARGGMIHRYVSLSERFGEDRALREPAALIKFIAREIVLARLK